MEISNSQAPTSSRKDIQISRRLFHMAVGSSVGTIYNLFLSHQQIVYILGTAACLLYLIEQIRVNYPELFKRFNIVNKYLLRAEEELTESAAVPYLMAVLLTNLTFPKSIALIAIFTLALGDPMSAIIGIKFGKHKISENKSYEGSIAFFLTVLAISLFILLPNELISTWKLVTLSFSLSLLVTLFELIPLKIDDNLTIPLFTSFILWILCGATGIQIM